MRTLRTIAETRRTLEPLRAGRTAALEALTAYVSDVRAGRFPEPRHTYSLSEDELRALERDLAAAAATRDE